MKTTLNDAWLWNKLTLQEKNEACLEALASDEVAPNLIFMLASVLNFRPNALMKKPREDLASKLASHMMVKKLRDGIEPVLRLWLVKSRGTLITDFLEAAGIPHDGAFIKDDAPELTAAQVAQGMEAVLKTHPASDLDLYLGYVLVFGDPIYWSALHAMAEEGHPLLKSFSVEA